MDLLIELIMSLLRGLFGEPEPTADPQRRTYRHDRDDSADVPRGTKSLAEMLEEARRQATGGAQQPSLSKPKAKPQPKPQPRPVTVKTVEPPPMAKTLQGEHVFEYSLRPLTSLPDSMPGSLSSLTQPSHESKKSRVKPAGKVTGPAVELTPVEAGSLLAATLRKNSATAAAELLYAPTEEARMAAALNGIVYAEILGPPRALRPYRPAYRNRR